MEKTGKTDARVDAYLDKHPQWREQFLVFRDALLAVGLDEDIKWGIPAYLCDGSNLIGFAGFKRHCALWFHQGVFLKDEAGKLSNAQEGKTQAMRQWKFSAGEAVPHGLLRDYALETIENHRAGKRVKPVSRPLQIPDELASARQEKTRLSRLEKSRPAILAGVGLHDRYR